MAVATARAAVVTATAVVATVTAAATVASAATAPRGVKEFRHECDGGTGSVLPSSEALPVLRRQRAEDRLQGHQAARPFHLRARQDRPEPHHCGVRQEAA